MGRFVGIGQFIASDEELHTSALMSCTALAFSVDGKNFMVHIPGNVNTRDLDGNLIGPLDQYAARIANYIKEEFKEKHIDTVDIIPGKGLVVSPRASIITAWLVADLIGAKYEMHPTVGMADTVSVSSNGLAVTPSSPSTYCAPPLGPNDQNRERGR